GRLLGSLFAFIGALDTTRFLGASTLPSSLLAISLVDRWAAIARHKDPGPGQQATSTVHGALSVVHAAPKFRKERLDELGTDVHIWRRTTRVSWKSFLPDLFVHH